ncbi:uncharacterized protein [Montipora capricornis]|uniref:uncharacterized protein n=1 Tax=Montipora capricornis TaxID=246305 RepID=UPI0035F15C81
MANIGSSWSLAGKSSGYSKHVVDPSKALFSVRKEKIQGMYQTEGMACSVLVKIDGRDVACFVSWSGVMINGDFNKPAQLNRFSKYHFGEYSLQVDSNSTVKTYGPFSFLEVGPIINSSAEPSKWNNLMFTLGFEALEKEERTSNFQAYCFVGSESLSLKLEFQEDTKLHKLVTSEKDSQKLEWSSLLGAPIIFENQKVKSSPDIARFSVVGIVGLSEEGEPCPYFVTNKIFAEQEASVHSPNEGIKSDDSSGQPEEKATGNPSGEQEVDAPGQPDEKATGNPSGEQEVDAPGRLTQVPIQKAFDQLGQPKEKATGNPSGEQEVDAPGMLSEEPNQEAIDQLNHRLFLKPTQGLGRSKRAQGSSSSGGREKRGQDHRLFLKPTQGLGRSKRAQGSSSSGGREKRGQDHRLFLKPTQGLGRSQRAQGSSFSGGREKRGQGDRNLKRLNSPSFPVSKTDQYTSTSGLHCLSSGDIESVPKDFQKKLLSWRLSKIGIQPFYRNICNQLNQRRECFFDDYRLFGEKIGLGKDEVSVIGQGGILPIH